MIKEKEIWKGIPGYEGLYLASTLGRIKSIQKYKGSSERILKGSSNEAYKQVVLCKNKVKKTWRVHQLIAITFLDHTPCGLKIVVRVYCL